MAGGDIIVFPQYAEIQREIDDLRGELATLLFERDDLIFNICRNLKIDYMVKFGALEYKVYELQCGILRIKRKIELIQAKLNKEETFSLPVIEKQLDEEYTEYAKILQEKIAQVNDALYRRNTMELLSLEDSAEIKRLYRKIVRCLHPDVNPTITEDGKRLFFNAVLSYEKGDIDGLRAIVLLIEGFNADTATKDSLAEMQNKKDCLLKQCDSTKNEISKIKSSFPFTQKELLKDEGRIAVYNAELNSILEGLKNNYILCEQKLQTVLEQEHV